jgi:hypothetical protein
VSNDKARTWLTSASSAHWSVEGGQASDEWIISYLTIIGAEGRRGDAAVAGRHGRPTYSTSSFATWPWTTRALKSGLRYVTLLVLPPGEVDYFESSMAAGAGVRFVSSSAVVTMVGACANATASCSPWRPGPEPQYGRAFRVGERRSARLWRALHNLGLQGPAVARRYHGVPNCEVRQPRRDSVREVDKRSLSKINCLETKNRKSNWWYKV